MDELYYEDGQVPDLASSGFTFSDEVIAKALVGIYKGEVDIDKGVEQNLYKETLRILNKATAKGISDAIDSGAPAPKKDFLYQLRHSNEVFSAFKTHTQQNHLADLLTDSKGKLKSFGQFAKDSEAVIGKYNRQWLRTEYDTAVIRAHQAANWQKFEEEKDVLPNLEWIPSTSPNPSEDHMVFWGTILPVDDGFWDAHRPGDRWNCKCDLRSTDKAATHAPDADIISKHDEPAKGLDNNPGKDGKIFNQSHPYFPKSCAACPFSSNGKPSPLADKIVGDCNRCGNVPTENKNNMEDAQRIYEEKKEVNKELLKWADENLPQTKSGKRFTTKDVENTEIIVNKAFYRQTFSKPMGLERMKKISHAAKNVHKWLPCAEIKERNVEAHHHSETRRFTLYKYEYQGLEYELQVVYKFQDKKNYMYYIRIIDD